MKTAVSVLQELAIKLGTTPEYECIGQTGPPHSAVFQYRCAALGTTVVASARSKKEAKQEAARLCLSELAACGLPVQPPAPTAATPFAESILDDEGGALPAYSYVALLRELCDQYRLPACAYQLVGDAGPAHLRHFTVRASVGAHIRDATATTKKAARQMAAAALYVYLRENLANMTRDFAENEALVRAHEKAMDRFRELRDEQPWRPDLGQRVADYPTGLLDHVEEERRGEASRTLSECKDKEAVEAVEAVLAALGLVSEWSTLPGMCGSLVVLQVPRASPALAFSAHTPGGAADAALTYLRLALQDDAGAPLPDIAA